MKITEKGLVAIYPDPFKQRSLVFYLTKDEIDYIGIENLHKWYPEVKIEEVPKVYCGS